MTDDTSAVEAVARAIGEGVVTTKTTENGRSTVENTTVRALLERALADDRFKFSFLFADAVLETAARAAMAADPRVMNVISARAEEASKWQEYVDQLEARVAKLREALRQVCVEATAPEDAHTLLNQIYAIARAALAETAG